MGNPYEGQRMIHIRLPEDLHKALRIKAAEADMSMNALVGSILADHLGWEPPKGSKKKKDGEK